LKLERQLLKLIKQVKAKKQIPEAAQKIHNDCKIVSIFF